MPDALESLVPVYPASQGISLADFAQPTCSPNIFWPRHSPAFSKLRHAVSKLPAQPYVVGVSGGADSMALAAAMLAENYEVYALSVDHQLQEQSAAVSQQAIQQLRALGAYGAVVTVEIPKSENLEAAARAARYQALSTPGVDIVVAHTQNDQAETALLQLLRSNLTAMALKSNISGVNGPVGLHRPLLEISRKDTAQAATELGFKIWQDPHNADTNFRRVAMRQEILPQLTQLHGGEVTASIAQAAQVAQQRQDFISQLAAQALEQAVGEETEEIAATSQLRVGSIAKQHPVLIQEVLRLWLRSFGVEISQAQSQTVLALVCDWHGQGQVALSGGWAVYRRKSILHLRKQEKRDS